MIGRVAALVALVAAPSAFAIGWWQGQHPAADPLTASVRLNAPDVVKPGDGAASAARYLANLNAPPPPAMPAGPIRLGPPAPPPIDVGVQFRRDVSAVMTGAEPHVVLAGGRKLAKGEVYRDGWKVRDLTAQNAVLVKGKDTRNINLFSSPQIFGGGVQPAAVTAPVFTQPMALTNGQQAGKMTAGQIQGLLDAFRGAGMPPGQIDNLRRALENGGPGAQAQVMNAMMQLARQRPLTPAQSNAIIQAMVRAGMIPASQAQQLAQMMPQLQALQGMAQAFAGPGFGGNRGGPGGGPGFGGPGGGGRGGNRGGGPGGAFGGRGANGGFGGQGQNNITITAPVPAPPAPPAPPAR